MNKFRSYLTASAVLLALLSPNLWAQPVVNNPSPGVYLLDDNVEYDWIVGCAPTAVAMMMGYWDRNGYGGLITGDSTKHSAAVVQMISSAGYMADYGSPTERQEYFGDPYGRIRDKSQGEPEHLDDSIADFLLAGHSGRGLDFGWTWPWGVSTAVHGYANHRGYGGFAVNRYAYASRSINAFEVLKTEIKAGRPLLAFVAARRTGTPNHVVLIVGFNENTREYALVSGWLDDDTLEGEGVRWVKWRSHPALWGVNQIWTVTPPIEGALQGPNFALVDRSRRNSSNNISLLRWNGNDQAVLDRQGVGQLSNRTIGYASGNGHEFYQIHSSGALYQHFSEGNGNTTWVKRTGSRSGIGSSKTRGFATGNNQTFWELVDNGNGGLKLSRFELNKDRRKFTLDAVVSENITGLSPDQVVGMTTEDGQILRVYSNEDGQLIQYQMNASGAGSLQRIGATGISARNAVGGIASWNPPATAPDDGDGTGSTSGGGNTTGGGTTTGGSTASTSVTEVFAETPISTSIERSNWHYYRFESPAAAGQYRIKLDSLTDDVDLYVRENELSTGDSSNGTFDCGSWSSGTAEEECSVEGSGKVWFISVHGYKAADYRLSVELIDGTVASEDTPLTVGASTAGATNLGEWDWYAYTPSAAGTMRLVLSDLHADNDLYVREGSRPSGHVDQHGDYDCGSTNGSTSDEVCEMAVEAGKTYYVGIYGYRASPYTITLTNGDGGSVSNTDKTLAIGASDVASVTKGGWAYYRVTPNGSSNYLNFTLSGLNDDADLYVRRGQQPSGHVNNAGTYDCGSWSSGTNNESCTVENTSGEDWYIAIYGYRATDFTLTSSTTATRTRSVMSKDALDKMDPKLAKSRAALAHREARKAEFSGMSEYDGSDPDVGQGAQDEESGVDSGGEGSVTSGGGGSTGVALISIGFFMAAWRGRRKRKGIISLEH